MAQSLAAGVVVKGGGKSFFEVTLRCSGDDLASDVLAALSATA